MKTPTLTAEAAIGPSLFTYAATARAVPAAGGTGRGSVAEMGFLDSIGDFFGGIVDKVPCLLGCGIPNAISIATRCGLDPVCWISQVPQAGSSCIRQCLS